MPGDAIPPDPVLYRSHAALAHGAALGAASLGDVLIALPPACLAEPPFVRGYSDCFLDALQFVAAQERLRLPDATVVTETVAVGATASGLGIQVELAVSVPGMAWGQARELIDKAHIVCPYSRAMRHTLDVRLTLA
ncbi:OsmC family protein [Paracidovorax avenae]|uniref:OsmC family protein n=1 Tax=Paracidovorax avenae TaxID=80867 RepID=UPI0018640121|nr:OsmC family protein [Paracidovorax avenae]